MDIGANLGVLLLVAFLASLDTAWACMAPPALPAGDVAPPEAKPDPAVAKIAGLTWRIERIGETPMPEGINPLVTIAADGSAVGTLVCNRFRTDFAIVGQPLDAGAFMMTRAQCEGEGAALEQRLVEALASVEGFDLSEDGWTLILERGDGALELRQVIMR